MTPARDGTGPEANGGGSQAPVRVLVVDDHEFFRTGVTAWLREQAGIDCCGEAASLAEAREMLVGTPADIVLLDLGMPDGDGLAFVGEAVQLQPGARIIVLSQHDEAVFAERAMRHGAHGYLMKSEASGKLLEAIRAVMAGGTWLSHAIQAQVDPIEFAARLRGETLLTALSDRELQVLALVGAGYGPKEIAVRLGISPKTVETHREHMRHKLGLQNAALLTGLAERWVRTGQA